MSQKAISGLLTASVLFWSFGCSNFRPLRENEGLNEFLDKKIEVRTKDGSRYYLDRWMRNSSGDITGAGRRRWETYDSHKGIDEKHVEPFSGTISAERIKSLKVEKKGDKIEIKTWHVIVGVVYIAALIASQFPYFENSN